MSEIIVEDKEGHRNARVQEKKCCLYVGNKKTEKKKQRRKV